MKPLTSIEIGLCQSQAKIFELSIDRTNCSSPIFIRRFMNSSIAKSEEKKARKEAVETEATEEGGDK